MDSSIHRTDNPFHAGEAAVQRRLGVEEKMLKVGQRVIRTWMPEQHQRFYEQLPFVMVGCVDALGRPWASVLVGEPGFMRAIDERTLSIAARPVAGDPLAEVISMGAPLGFLGIELETRRRNRMAGSVLSVEPGSFTVGVQETIGNCPQYIQTRHHQWVRPASEVQARGRASVSALVGEARALVERADTLYVASHAVGRTDVSHRGGRRGFIKLESERSFVVPDFAGNAMFMTLGNFELDPRAGVLFIDWDSGDLLTLTGRATTIWDGDPLLQGFEGAERAWRFEIEEGLLLRDALPLRASFGDWSPNSLITGTWDEAQARRDASALARTWRPFRVARVHDESSVIRSLYLEPADGHGVAPFLAGQHLPIRLKPPGSEAWLQRTYTLSVAPGDHQLRISVKRDGVASTALHALSVGDVIEAQGARGRFTIDALASRPAVLIGAGVGITPMVAFLRHIALEGFRQRRTRPTWLIQVARDAQQLAFGDEIARWVATQPQALKAVTVLDVPEGRALAGPFSVDLLRQILPFDDHEFFLCGPRGFMQVVYDGLRTLGVRDTRIHAEAFGPSSLKRSPESDAAPLAAPRSRPHAADTATVRFLRSGIEASWNTSSGTLLELAEACGAEPVFGCRAGHCGSCATRITAGEVLYPDTPEWPVSSGEVLLCCAVPAEGSAEIGLEV